MAFIVMVPTQGETRMVAVATVSGIRKQHVIRLIVAYQVSAAGRSRQALRLSAKSALAADICGMLLFSQLSRCRDQSLPQSVKLSR